MSDTDLKSHDEIDAMFAIYRTFTSQPQEAWPRMLAWLSARLDADSRPLYHWPDGQVREDKPYRCGAFLSTNGLTYMTREGCDQCTLLSDHDGPHVFESELSALDAMEARP